MTGFSIGEILPYAIGIALSPVPIIAVILMLLSARARENGPAFLAGWVIGIAVLTTVIVIIAKMFGADSDEDASDLVDWIKIVLGLGMLVLAYKQWQTRPAAGEEASMPSWMAGVESVSPGRALTLGLLLSAVNPKNAALAIAAGGAIAQADVDAVHSVIAVVVFVLIASCTTGGAVGFYFFGGAGARASLDSMKAWLEQNGATVMAVLLLVIGVVVLGDGISGISV